MSSPNYKPCPECGGPRFPVPLDPRVGVQYSTWFPSDTFSALACLNCGYTTLYTNPASARNYVEKHQQKHPPEQ